jgi:hypothetical protein
MNGATFCFTLIVVMMLLHFIADALLQSREMGQKKSSEWKWLAKHIAIIFSVITAGLWVYWRYTTPEFTALQCLQAAAAISGINAVIHAIIDSVIWRGYKVYVYWKFRNTTLESDYLYCKSAVEWDMIQSYSKKQLVIFAATNNYKYWEDHNFYSTILFDQLLHMLTIVGVVWYLFV